MYGHRSGWTRWSYTNCPVGASRITTPAPKPSVSATDTTAVRARALRETDGRKVVVRAGPPAVCDAGDRAGEVRGAARRRDHVANETIPAARNRLNHTGVGTQRAADLANAEIDVLVVLDDAIGPQARTNLLARHQLSGVLYQQQEELRGLRLQRAALDSTAEDAAPGIEHVRSESDEGRHETIIR